jgi:hypothetical protein
VTTLVVGAPFVKTKTQQVPPVPVALRSETGYSAILVRVSVKQDGRIQDVVALSPRLIVSTMTRATWNVMVGLEPAASDDLYMHNKINGGKRIAAPTRRLLYLVDHDATVHNSSLPSL